MSSRYSLEREKQKYEERRIGEGRHEGTWMKYGKPAGTGRVLSSR